MPDTEVLNRESYMQNTDVQIRPSRTSTSTGTSRAGNVYHVMPSNCQLTLPELVKSYTLPRIVRCVDARTEPGDDTQPGGHNQPWTGKRQGQLDLTCPLLAYSCLNVTRVSAYCLHYDPSLRDYLLLDRALLIPDSYTGWFSVLGPPSAGFMGPEVVPHFRSVTDLASRRMSQFLVGGRKSLSGVMVHRQLDQKVTNIPCRVLPGTLLTTAGLYRDPGSLRPDGAVGHPSPVSPRLFLKCVDEHHRELLLDVRVTGVFYLVNGHGSPPPLYRMADILQRFKLPVVVQLVYGRSPPFLPSHTFLLTSSSQCQSLLVSPLSSSNFTAEIPLDADLKFEVSPKENRDETRLLEANTLQHCWETAPCSVTDIKVVLETPPRVHDYQDIDNPDSPSPEVDPHDVTNKLDPPGPLLSSQSASDLSKLSDWSFLSKCILVNSDLCLVYESCQVYPTAIADFCLSTSNEDVCGGESGQEAHQLPLSQRKVNLFKQNCIDDPQDGVGQVDGSRGEPAPYTTLLDTDSPHLLTETVSTQSDTCWNKDSATSPNYYSTLVNETKRFSDHMYAGGYDTCTQPRNENPEDTLTHSSNKIHFDTFPHSSNKIHYDPLTSSSNKNCRIEPMLELSLKLDIASNSRPMLPPKPHKTKPTPHPNKPLPNPNKPTPHLRKPMTPLVNISPLPVTATEKKSETLHGQPKCHPAPDSLTETQEGMNSVEVDVRHLVRVDTITLADLDDLSFSTYYQRMPLSSNWMFPDGLSESSIKNSASDGNFASEYISPISTEHDLEYISPISTEHDLEYTSLISTELDLGTKLDGTGDFENHNDAGEVFPADSGLSESLTTNRDSQTFVKSVCSTTSVHNGRITSADSGNSTQTYPKSPSSSSWNKPTLWSVSEDDVFTSGESSLTHVKTVPEMSASCESNDSNTSNSSLTHLKNPYVVTSNKNIYQTFPLLPSQKGNILSNGKNVVSHLSRSVPDKHPLSSGSLSSEKPLGALAQIVPQFRTHNSALKISPLSGHASPTPSHTSPTPSRVRAPHTRTAPTNAPPLPDKMTPGSCIVKMCSNLTNRFTEASKNELIDQMVKAGVSQPTELALRSLQVADYIYLMDRKDDLDKALVTFLPKLGKFDLRTIAMCFNGLRLTN